jgi:hypothetical protein
LPSGTTMKKMFLCKNKFACFSVINSEHLWKLLIYGTCQCRIF